MRLADLLSSHPKASAPVDTNLARTMLQKFRKVMAGANSKVELSDQVATGATTLFIKKQLPVTVGIVVEDQGPGKLGLMRAHLVAEGTDLMSLDDKDQAPPRHQPARSVSPIQSLARKINKFLAEDYGGSVRIEYLQDYLDEFVFRWNHRGEDNRGKVFCHLLAEAMNTKKA